MRIAIIGLGLIGGSIGLALRKASPETVIGGYSRRREQARLAVELGAVSSVGDTPESAVEGASLVVVATPVLTIKDILTRIAPHLAPGTVVTDTASTKSLVMRWAEESLPPQVEFVGGHPMAGKETSGIRAATAGLFRDCVYCLTPGPRATSRAVDMVTDMVRKLGASPLTIAPERHDFLVGGISHLPFVLSAALVSVTSGDPAWPELSRLAGSGYRDLTRLASGNPEVTSQISLSNRTAIATWLSAFISELERFRGLLTEGQEAVVVEYFTRARQARQTWLEDRC